MAVIRVGIPKLLYIFYDNNLIGLNHANESARFIWIGQLRRELMPDYWQSSF